MSRGCTKIVLRRGVVHVIDQLLGEAVQLFLRPGCDCPLQEELHAKSKELISLISFLGDLRMPTDNQCKNISELGHVLRSCNFS